MEKKILLSTAYFPPVRYLTKFFQGNEVLIEDDENYVKQTYRNRCQISTANGIETLTVPVERGSFHKVHIRDVRIDYHTRWIDIHCRALRTAYRASPFYEFYIPELRDALSRKPKYLIDLNTRLLEFLLQAFTVPQRFGFTGTFIQPGTPGYSDYRNDIHPKKNSKDPRFDPVSYPQVFEDKFGFLPNLSALDLLFNTGPDGGGILKECVTLSN